MLVAVGVGCSGRKSVEPPAPQNAPASEDSAPAPVPAAAVLKLYDDAATLDPLTLTTLASQEGLSALLGEAAREPKHRRAAIAALPYTKRLAAADYLAHVAVDSDAERALAFDALGELAATAKRNEDPEDVVELRRGCTTLTQFVAGSKGKKEERARALSCVRALVQHGCVAPDTADYDAK